MGAKMILEAGKFHETRIKNLVMPGKRRNMRHVVIKQATKSSRAIKTRLIEISHKVEDVVYNKKPITEQEAEKYLKEVISYRSFCCKDERALQVIEKLTRCMKAIIAEQEELRLNQNITDDDSSVEFDIRSSTSPVYSLPDEDRIQLTQTFVDVNDLHNNVSNTIATDKPNYYEETRLTQSIQGLEITENNQNDTMQLYNDVKEHNDIAVNKNNALNDRPSQDLDLHTALSNLSITDTNLDDESINIESSQSILNNIHPLLYLITPPLTNKINFNESERIESTKMANKEYVTLGKETNNFYVNEKSTVAKSDFQEIEKFPVNDCQNRNKLQQTETIHFDFPSSTNNNVIIKPNPNRADKSVFCNTDFEKQIPVVYNNANTILLFNNKIDSNVKNQAADNKFNIRDQISAKILTSTKNAKESKFSTKPSSDVKDIHKPASHTNQESSVQQTYNTIKENNNNCVDIADNNAKCNKTLIETTINMNNTMQHFPINSTIKKAMTDTKPTYNIKKKRRPQKSKEDMKSKIKKNTNVKNVMPQKRININDLNKTEEYQPKRKYKKQSVEKKIPIYNKNVVNDLSWLENIRFVREIGEDEYERNNLDENFWENYELPPYFDQNNFL